MESKARRILEEIKSSDLIENRVQLLTQLAQLDIEDKSDVPSLMESLATFWEDFTCLDVSQCLLNKAILCVASKYLALDLPDCLHQFLGLGVKVSQWCAKHLKMSLMSMEESQEEGHSNIFFQLLLDYFCFSASSFTAISKYSSMNDKALGVTVHKFVSDQLNITKEVILNAKKVDTFSEEILKAAQMVIDCVVRLCKECYSQAKDKDTNDRTVSNFLSMTELAVKALSELGILAAKDGGNLVSILNSSWKGVITLLQIDKHTIVSKVEVADIILMLISLVKESLTFAAEGWSRSVKEVISATEARRVFLPVKFYLINAVKVVALFPSQAYVVFKEIALCILMIFALKFSLSQESHGKPASEVMTDLLEKTSIDLLNALLNSDELKREHKDALLDWLFMDAEGFKNQTGKSQSHDLKTASLVDIFSFHVESATSTRILLLARVVLFQSVLRHSSVLKDDAKWAITTKLQWFLDILMDKEVYSSVLSSQIPIADGPGKSIVWEPMFSALVLSLKTLSVVLSSSTAWEEFEMFLLQNFLHPHFLCWQIVMELWCFWARYATGGLVNDMVDKLCAFMMTLSSSQALLLPDSALRKTTRFICFLLKHGPKSLADQVYNYVFSESRSQFALDVYLALLLEGFPQKFLSDSTRKNAKQWIIADYLNFIENFNGKPPSSSAYSVSGGPVFALSACLQSLPMIEIEIDTKTLKFVANLISKYRNTKDQATRNHQADILGETITIIPKVEELYTSLHMDSIVLELQKLFISSEPDPLYKCKPGLALFMAGLSHTGMSESGNCPKSCAVWELYHMLLRERHWALVHLALTAFGHFCARTSCKQLWRFVPNDAALAYKASGNESSTEQFMSELKMFLEKEHALLATEPLTEQIELLAKEGRAIKGKVKKLVEGGGEGMETGEEGRPKKRRKLPGRICRGIELLQKGVKAIDEGLCHWRSDQTDCEEEEMHNKLLNHLSCLKDLVSHLAGLDSSDMISST
ncbi:PREDICTED: uncharacterized protein LOC104816017 [Tarenaya hassleriana]|uniref:uncharacterized protein LOC104816017 n=1 Tax=Tarenaya hassleriana TaxID=28532 RepID=UPI00053C4BDF|nr:PREDICTED: uncharacterized protein LOC104816017 [Tarenaya hassleriana]